MTDPYRTIGVHPDADPEVLEAAYRALALKFHPDRNPAGAGRMKEVTAAYAVLSDPQRRAELDALRSRSASATAGAPTSAPGYSPPPERGTAVPTGVRGVLDEVPDLRAVVTVLLLGAGALAWHLYMHQPWRPSLALAYPVAALPSGIRAWVRWVRTPRLADVPGPLETIELNLLSALGHALVMVLGGVVICPVEFIWIVVVRPVARAAFASWSRRRPRGWCR